MSKEFWTFMEVWKVKPIHMFHNVLEYGKHYLFVHVFYLYTQDKLKNHIIYTSLAEIHRSAAPYQQNGTLLP
jgi:hypothetical protein